MTPPNPSSSVALAVQPGSGPGTKAEAAQCLPRYGKAYAVPVREMPHPSHRPTEAVYRAFEILIATFGLIAGLPLMLIVAALIRWDSPGPALFFHRRPGRSTIMRGADLVSRDDLRAPSGGYEPEKLYYVPSCFRIVKFRTMYDDARTRFPQYYAYRYAPGEFYRQYPTLRYDPRVTRIGRVLRKLSLDELPNLWSVLVGDMRLVGPRPEAPEVLQYYSAEEMYKFACKPGITGLAQINGRGFLNWGETLRWDLEYVQRRSISLDLKILLITSRQVIIRHGAF